MAVFVVLVCILLLIVFGGVQYFLCSLYNWLFYRERHSIVVFSLISGVMFPLMSMILRLILLELPYSYLSWLVMYVMVFLISPFPAAVMIDVCRKIANL